MLPVRVVIIDDDQLIHDAIAASLKLADDMTVVGNGYQGRDAIDLCKLLKPDVVLMDVMMPGMDGAEATRLLLEHYSDVRVLALSSATEYEYIKGMIDSGAAGYIVKGVPASDLLNAIRLTHQGTSVLSQEAMQLLASPPGTTALNSLLTKREQEILDMMANGLSNRAIAAQLDVNPRTVSFHLENILEKMNVSTRSEALVFAAKNNLI